MELIDPAGAGQLHRHHPFGQLLVELLRQTERLDGGAFAGEGDEERRGVDGAFHGESRLDFALDTLVAAGNHGNGVHGAFGGALSAAFTELRDDLRPIFEADRAVGADAEAGQTGGAGCCVDLGFDDRRLGDVGDQPPSFHGRRRCVVEARDHVEPSASGPDGEHGLVVGMYRSDEDVLRLDEAVGAGLEVDFVHDPFE